MTRPRQSCAQPDPIVTTTFIDSHSFELGGRHFELYSVRGGETLDSLVVWMPKERSRLHRQSDRPALWARPQSLHAARRQDPLCPMVSGRCAARDRPRARSADHRPWRPDSRRRGNQAPAIACPRRHPIREGSHLGGNERRRRSVDADGQHLASAGARRRSGPRQGAVDGAGDMGGASGLVPL